MRRPLFIELVSEDNGCMAETAITINGHVLGYVGASRYTCTTEADAEEAIINVFKRLLQQEPGVEERSRFHYEYDGDDE